MQVTIKYFYADGAEMNQHDIVYLKGYDSNRGEPFSGVCKVASCNGELFSAYFLGQRPYSCYDIEMYLGDIDKLVKLDSKEIEGALNRTMENYKLE